MTMIVLALAVLLPTLGLAPTPCAAQDAARILRASDFTFHAIFATRAADATVYILLGGGWARTISSGDPDVFIAHWLAAHPDAIVTPISQEDSRNTRTNEPYRMTYIWVDAGVDSLNVDMVRQGMYPGGTMLDMVDNERGLDRLLRSDPRLADTRAEIERERAQGLNRLSRLIADRDYALRMRRIEAAESKARADKLGIWSDAMRDERREEGYR
jgi:hypothetical protein